MTYVITDKHLTEDRVYKEYYCDNVMFAVDARPEVVKHSVTYDLAKESRPKPQSLLTNMTAQAQQITVSEIAGWVRYRSDTLVNGCTEPNYPWDKKDYHSISTWTHRLLGTNPSTPSHPEPDWITPLRLQVANMKVNLGEDLAEYRQTSSMFENTAVSAVNAWRRFKGKKARRRRKLTPCSISAANLMYSYGVAPLIGTLFDSYQALRAELDHPSIFKVIQTASETTPYDILTPNDNRIVGKTTCSARAKAYLHYRRGAMENFSFGNPLSIAWELVPYSFVFDYMIPVGNTLMALDALLDIDAVYGTVTRRILDKSYQTVDEGQLNGTIVSELPSIYQVRRTERDVLTSIPLPPFPKWKPSASWHKLRNAVALLHQERKC